MKIEDDARSAFADFYDNEPEILVVYVDNKPNPIGFVNGDLEAFNVTKKLSSLGHSTRIVSIREIKNPRNLTELIKKL